jgi:hypothetical protein
MDSIKRKIIFSNDSLSKSYEFELYSIIPEMKYITKQGVYYYTGCEFELTLEQIKKLSDIFPIKIDGDTLYILN